MEHVELRGERGGRRLLAAGLLLAMGLGLVAYAVTQLFTPQSEWITVEAGVEEGATCGGEFTFLYRLGAEGLSPREERRAVTECYTQLCRKAYQMFQTRETFGVVTSLRTINSQPNTALEVEPALYRALWEMEESGSRALYLGPIYERYEGVFFCQEDRELADFDPRLNEEIRREFQTIADFANDPDSIQLELLGEGRVCLRVSEEYLAWAQREDIDTFIDFAWMRNAFVADYLARELEFAGYGRGVLSSYDGFVRNMDSEAYTLLLYDRQGQTVYTAAEIAYQGPQSAVSLRNFPVSELDSWRFYQLENGGIRTWYLDPADGLCRSAVPSLTCYGTDWGCGEILLAMLPVYVADELRTEELDRLAEAGVQSVYCQGGVIYHTDPQLPLTELREAPGSAGTVLSGES